MGGGVGHGDAGGMGKFAACSDHEVLKGVLGIDAESLNNRLPPLEAGFTTTRGGASDPTSGTLIFSSVKFRLTEEIHGNLATR